MPLPKFEVTLPFVKSELERLIVKDDAFDGLIAVPDTMNHMGRLMEMKKGIINLIASIPDSTLSFGLKS